jgi:hypothetical protein
LELVLAQGSLNYDLELAMSFVYDIF